MIIRANAKINLGLEVLRKRPDGYHDINTVFVQIPLFDTLEINPSKTLACRTEPDLHISQEKNLAFRAAKSFLEYFKIDAGADIYIKKNIPHGGGLGGGSSDAAHTILALNDLYAPGAAYEDLLKIAAGIGSDVPYFLRRGAAVARGRGELLEYFDYESPFRVMFVFPGLEINTAEAYASLNIGESQKEPTDLKSAILESKFDSSVLKKKLSNDFERPAFAKYPQIARIKETLYDSGAVFALMSGSGSTVYGLFDNPDNIKSAQNSLSNYRTFVAG